MDILNNKDEIISLLNILKDKLNNENNYINSIEEKTTIDNFTLENNNNIICRIDNLFDNICNHKWIYDYTDDFYGNTIQIKYCEYCGKTKK
jgi:hypothetical protein